MASDVLFKGQGIKITDSEVQIGRDLYHKEDITSVTVEEVPMSAGMRIGIAALGCVILLFGSSLWRNGMLCAAPLAFLALVFFYAAATGPTTYRLKLSTPNGEQVILNTNNQGQVRKVQQALEQYVLQARQSSSEVG